MRALFAAASLLALLASCGLDPKPKDSKLPCDHGCPSSYVCRADNRCWHNNTPAVDSGLDGPAVVKDVAGSELGGVDNAGKEIPDGSSLPVDVGITADLSRADTTTTVDTSRIDGADDSSIDVPMGTGGAGGSGGNSGSGGSSGTGGYVGSGGTSGGTGGAGGTVGSTSDAAPDAALSKPDAACIPETDQQMCIRLGKNCNAVTDFDHCEKSRAIASCGTSQGSLVCRTFAPQRLPNHLHLRPVHLRQLRFRPVNEHQAEN
jgi:hypothetical protein